MKIRNKKETGFGAHPGDVTFLLTSFSEPELEKVILPETIDIIR